MRCTVEYQVVSLFSFRAITNSAFAARTLLCPTPAGVKLGLLAGLLRRDGPEDGRAQALLDWLAPLGVAWRPPATIAVTAATMKIWKSGEKRGAPLVPSVGMREYAHMAEPFGLALLGVPPARRADADFALSALRALGAADSLVQPLAPPLWEEDDALPPGYTLLTPGKPAAASAPGGGALPPDAATVLLDDLGPTPRFERLSAYRDPDPATIPELGRDRVRHLVTLPLRVRRWTVLGPVWERLDGEVTA